MRTFDALKAQLEQQDWPNLYMFKFIVPNDNHHLAQVTALFNANSEISYHHSGNGKYVSLSAKEIMLSADDIIAVYERAALIPGIISL
ncbi:MAG: DUF493 family protein [Sphingomonadales bacterium]|nr:DUF493 family protein [Sphingomonadales bacterium]